MAFTLKIPGGAGSCCDCDSQVDCQCGPPCSLSCRSKSNIDGATLCGFSEFTDASTPPKKYRLKTYSGGWKSEYRHGSDCSGSIEACDQVTVSGTKSYDKDTCGLTDSSDYFFQSTGCSGHCTPFTINDHFSAPDGFTSESGILNVVEDQVSQTWEKNNLCVTAPACGTNRIATDDGGTQILSDEDTEADAIARANAAVPSWSTPGSCLLNSAFIARNDADFTMSYRSEQVQATITELTPGNDYTVTIRFGKRLVGTSGPFIADSLTEIHFTAGGTTETTDWIDVPNEDGYETVPISCAVRSGA